MSNRRVSLLEQAELEMKRRQLASYGEQFQPDVPYADQLERILPNIKWIDKQKAFINARQFEKWLKGGYKSSKSFTGVAYDIWLSYVNKPYPGILVHPTADGIDITILPLIEEHCQENKIEYEIKKLSTKWKVFFKFGIHKRDWGQLILASGDRPKSLKGPKLAFGHIDEPLIMDEEINEIIVSRLAEAKGKLNQLIYTGTPEPLNMKWGFDIAEMIHVDNEDMYLETISTMDVKQFLPDGYVENMMKKFTPEQIEAFIHGRHVNMSQFRCYPNFKKDTCVYDPLEAGELEGDIELILGFDFNVKQMSSVLIERAGREKRQCEEFRIQSRSSTHELAKLTFDRMIQLGYLVNDGSKVRTKYGKSLIICGDASGKAGSSKSLLSDYEIIMEIMDNFAGDMGIDYVFQVPEANPAVRDRTNYVDKEFETGFFKISNKCPLSIRDRELTQWKQGAAGFFVDKSKAEISHLADAGDYAVFNTQILDDDTGSMVSATARETRW